MSGAASRTTSARSPGSPAATPVCAGLSTATRSGVQGGDRGGDDGLADAGPGAGDHEDPPVDASPGGCRNDPRRRSRGSSGSHRREDLRQDLADPREVGLRQVRPGRQAQPAGARRAPTAAGNTPPGPRAPGRRGPPPRPPPARPAPPARPPTAEPAARRRPRGRPRARSTAAGRPGSASSTCSAASAAPTDGGARPVSKMNERAVSTRCAVTASGPSTAPPWAPSAFDSVTVATTSSAPASPTSASSPRPPGPAHAQPVRLVHHQQRAPRPADGVQRAQRGGVAVHAVDALHHHQRPLLVAGGEHRVDRGGVVVRHHRDPRPGQPAGVDERRVVRRVGDDERPGARQRRHHAEVRGVAGGEHQPGGEPAERGELALQRGVQLRGPGDQPRARRPGPPAHGRRRPPRRRPADLGTRPR